MSNFDDFPQAPSPRVDLIPSYRNIIPVSQYSFYIGRDIESPEEYVELINTLQSASSHDTIVLNINSEGGNLYTALEIIGAIDESDANVITCLSGLAASAASMIFLAAKENVVGELSTMMIHTVSHTLHGRANDTEVYSDYMKKFNRKIFTEIYSNFLSSNEINDVIDGKTIWLDSGEIISRLKKRSKLNDQQEKLSDQLELSLDGDIIDG